MRDGDQQLIAHEMTVRVVDALEVIEVHHEHRARPALATDPGVRLGESVHEQRAIGEAREGDRCLALG